MRALILIALLASQAHAFVGVSYVTKCPCVEANHAPNWSQDPAFRGIYDFEDTFFDDADNQYFLDTSSAHNDLQSSSGQRSTSRALLVKQQCSSAVASTFTNCLSPRCTDSDFCPVGTNFTAGCWIRPDDRPSSYRATMMGADTVAGDLGEGWMVGFTGAGATANGKFTFAIDPNTAGAERLLQSTATYATGDVYHHQVGRFLANTGDMVQFIDGVLDPATQTSPAIEACANAFPLGASAFEQSITGYEDECFYANEALDDSSICRIAVCGIDGCNCACDWAGDPTQYTAMARHVDGGGSIDCVLPACNATGPVYLTTTSTTSSSSSSSTTTTSTSSTTSTT